MTTDALTVTHTISLRGADAATVVTALTAHAGVLHVSADEIGRNVHVTYDLGRLRREGIETIIDATGGKPAKGIFAAFQRNWTKFTEDNVLASVARPYSSCCNRPPK